MAPNRDGLSLSNADIAALVDTAAEIVKRYWRHLPERRSYPQTSGAETATLFSAPWNEHGAGSEILASFEAIADRSRPAGDRFFGYVFGSGDPVSVVSELLIGETGFLRGLDNELGQPIAAAAV